MRGSAWQPLTYHQLEMTPQTIPPYLTGSTGYHGAVKQEHDNVYNPTIPWW